jgi:hypothetical protein
MRYHKYEQAQAKQQAKRRRRGKRRGTRENQGGQANDQCTAIGTREETLAGGPKQSKQKQEQAGKTNKQQTKKRGREGRAQGGLWRLAAEASVCRDVLKSKAELRRNTALAFSRWIMMPRFWYRFANTWLLRSPDIEVLSLAS